MCVVTRYCLAVLLADCSTLPAHCRQNSAVQQTFALLVAGASQMNMGHAAREQSWSDAIPGIYAAYGLGHRSKY